jgi:hypothetical protein
MAVFYGQRVLPKEAEDRRKKKGEPQPESPPQQ